jgi:hypothetical protein
VYVNRNETIETIPGMCVGRIKENAGEGGIQV